MCLVVSSLTSGNQVCLHNFVSPFKLEGLETDIHLESVLWNSEQEKTTIIAGNRVRPC